MSIQIDVHEPIDFFKLPFFRKIRGGDFELNILIAVQSNGSHGASVRSACAHYAGNFFIRIYVFCRDNHIRNPKVYLVILAVNLAFYVGVVLVGFNHQFIFLTVGTVR